jgi:hypothetical protein
MRIFSTIAAMMLSLGAMAWSDTKLTISPTGNSNIRVMVDGNKYNRNSGGTVVITNLSAGYHTVKVFQVLIKRQFHTDIAITRFGKVQMDEVLMDANYADSDDDDDDWNGNGNNGGGWQSGGGNNGNGGNCGNGNNGGGWNNGGGQGGGWGNNMQAMDNRTFEQFKQTLRNESFDNGKTAIAKQTMLANYFTAAQVKEIVSLFSFENSKLEIAKYAYRYTVDKGSYFLVNDAFSYSSSKDELMNYVRTYRA